MRILALDCATKTGWCVWDNDGIQTYLESGVQDFSKQRGESNGAMFLRFRHWLHSMLENKELCIYEQAHHRGGAATEIGVNLTGRVQEICEELKVEYASVHSGTLKKFATGKGNADKALIMAEAKVILRRDPIDDNEADAVLMAKYASVHYG